MSKKGLRWQHILIILCFISTIMILHKPAKIEAAIVQSGYNETTTNLTKHVGESYTIRTNIDGVAKWSSSDSSIVRINSYNNSAATMSFLKEGKARVTFQHTYTYIQPIFNQTGTTTGIWTSKRCQGMTVVYLNIEVKKAIGNDLFAGGNGTYSNPYLISTKKQLANMNNTQVLNAYFKLTNDIAFSPEDFAPGGEFYNDGHGWFPIGFYIPGVYGQAFRGVFDGDGHVISGLQCSYYGTGNLGKGYYGLFSANNYGTIKNLGIENSTFLCYSASDSGTDFEYVGAIAGINTGTISNCYSKNNIIGGNCAGGIVGYNQRLIYNCYSANNTFGPTSYYFNHPKGFIFGGLIGTVDVSYTGISKTFFDCYTADLNFMGWYGHSGALAGYLTYNTEFSDTYFSNTDVSAYVYTRYSSIGKTYYKQLTDSEMKVKDNFKWLDFTNTWYMDSTSDYLYPQLKVFKKLEQALYVSSLPTKSIYMIGEKVDLTGGKVSFTNSDGKNYTYSMSDPIFRPVTGTTLPESQKGTISAVNTTTKGTKTITIEYKGQKTQFQIYVIDSKMNSNLKITCDNILSGSTLQPKIVQNDSQGSVIFHYYNDSLCKKEITRPSKPGIYYVRAVSQATNAYNAATSNILKVTIQGRSFAVGNVSSKIYSGKAITQSISVTSGTSKLVLGRDYSLSYRNNKEVGKASIIVSGMGNYIGKVEKYFYILPAKVVGGKGSKAASSKINLVWTSSKSKVSGYEIQMSTAKNSGYKSITSVQNKKAYTYKNTKLKKKTTYYFKIRAYIVIDGKKQCGTYSDVISVKM